MRNRLRSRWRALIGCLLRHTWSDVLLSNALEGWIELLRDMGEEDGRGAGGQDAVRWEYKGGKGVWTGGIRQTKSSLRFELEKWCSLSSSYIYKFEKLQLLQCQWLLIVFYLLARTALLPRTSSPSSLLLRLSTPFARLSARSPRSTM